jgi:hypothetical protein
MNSYNEAKMTGRKRKHRFVDPFDLVAFDRTDRELQEWALFSGFTRNTDSESAQAVLYHLIIALHTNIGKFRTPFEGISKYVAKERQKDIEPWDAIFKIFEMPTISDFVSAREGSDPRSFGKINDRADVTFSLWDNYKDDMDGLRTNTRDELRQKVKGVGHKIASFIPMYSREFDRSLLNTDEFDASAHAVLDTHILKALALEPKPKGVRRYNRKNVPSETPKTDKQYRFWAEIFIDFVNALGKEPKDLDFEWWQKYSEKKPGGSWLDPKRDVPDITKDPKPNIPAAQLSGKPSLISPAGREVQTEALWQSLKKSWEAMSRAPLIEAEPTFFAHSPYGSAIKHFIQAAWTTPEVLPELLEQYSDPRLICEVTSADASSLRRGMEALGRHVSRRLFEGYGGANHVVQILAAVVLDSLQDYPGIVANAFAHQAVQGATQGLCESISPVATSETIQESEKPSTAFRNVLGSMLPGRD